MNSIELAKVFQKELDSVLIEESTTGWMDAYAKKFIQYEGGDTVMIADLEMNGLADYKRTLGFQKGNLTLKFKPYKMTQDRGRSFMIDSMDVDESNFVASATTVLGEFQRTHVVPEIDSYRYSKIAKEAMAENRATYGYTPTKETIFEKITEDITQIQEQVGMATDLVITMPISVANTFYNSDKVKNLLNITENKANPADSSGHMQLNTVIKTLNGIPIITPPSSRMKTEYKFFSGDPSGTEAEKGGFEATSTAKNINWIIAARQSILAVNKCDKPRIFQPNENLYADAWKIDYRRYHDLWILKNRVSGILVNIRESK